MLKKTFVFFFIFSAAFVSSENGTDSVQYYLKLPNDIDKVENLLRLGRMMESNDLEKASSTINKALQSSREIKYDRGEIDALISLSIINNYKSRSSTADSLLQAALPIAIRTGNRSSEGNIYNNLGMSYFDKFDYQRSLQYYFKALTIFEDEKKETKYASTLNNIANLYYTLKEPDKALNYHSQSLAISRKTGEKSKIASSLYNIGLVYLEKNDPLKALSYYQESLQLAKEINHKVGQSMLYNSIGKCYRLLKDHEKALEYCNHSLDIKKELGDKNGIATLHNSIGDIYFEMRDYKKAVEYSGLSLAEGKEVNSIGIMQNAYKLLANSYSAQKRYDLAYQNYRLYTEYKDSLFNTEKRTYPF